MNDNLAQPPGSPVGTIWATSFEVIPEPAAAGLVLALSAFGFAGVRRVNNKR
ncbi:MAG TPA: PEP-CTERM sorting domain-containing protein [Candidatus Paceibacterota bacterium]|nr:PEP-CTERM sorting domain-containing protein [Candidatus Paceibacterota bacterium]HRZ58743.1 PEP-CTERM sorting domain-containing protein [Candidatus Paceibacterota bacterium]